MNSFYYYALTLLIQLMDISLKCKNIKMKIISLCRCVCYKLGFIAEDVIMGVRILGAVLKIRPCLAAYVTQSSKYLK